MSNYAKVENGIVSNIIKIPDEFDTNYKEYLASLGYFGEWVLTPTENGSEAALGYNYHPESKIFIAKQPSPLHIFVDNNWIIPLGDFNNNLPPSPPTIK